MKKLFGVLLFIFSLLEINAQTDSLDLEVVWQKEVFPKSISDAKFSVDGQWIYAGVGKTIEKISPVTGEFSGKFDNAGLTNDIGEMDISVLGNLIVTRELGLACNLWDTHLEKAIKHLTYYKDSGLDGIRAVAISPDEKYLVLSINESYNNGKSNYFYLVVYDIKNDIDIKKIPIDLWVTAIKFSHDGKYFAIGGRYKNESNQKDYDKVTLWETETWSQVKEIENLEGVGSGYSDLKFSNNDRYLGVVRNNPYTIKIYELENSILKYSSEDNFFSLGFLPDNNHFLTFFANSSDNYYLELHNLESTIKKYKIPTDKIDVFNSNGSWKIFCNIKNLPMTLMTQKIVGVVELPQPNQIIYPNPTDGFINIDIDCLNSNNYFEIFDNNSLLVSPHQNIPIGQKFLSIDFSKYPSGLYFLKLYCGTNVSTYKIIKEG